MQLRWENRTIRIGLKTDDPESLTLLLPPLSSANGTWKKRSTEKEGPGGRSVVTSARRNRSVMGPNEEKGFRGFVESLKGGKTGLL